MGLFDAFKKKKKLHYDPVNVTVRDMDLGFVFEYDLKTWVVNEMYEYDWGGNFFTHEYKIDNGEEVLFLGVEDDDELEITLMNKIKVSSLGVEVIEKLDKKKKPPKSILYRGVTYLRDSESPGFFRNVADGSEDDAWSEILSWDYYDESEKHVLCVEKWGESEFEASVGKTIKEFEISNIIPQNEE